MQVVLPVPAQQNPILDLVQVLFYFLEEIIDAIHMFITIPQDLLVLLAEIRYCTMDRKTVLCSAPDKLVLPLTKLFAFPRCNRTFVYTQPGIRNDQVLINSENLRKPFTYRTCTKWIIERKQIGNRLFKLIPSNSNLLENCNISLIHSPLHALPLLLHKMRY